MCGHDDEMSPGPDVLPRHASLTGRQEALRRRHAPAMTPMTAMTSEPQSQQRLRVLCLEDSPAEAEKIRRTLVSAGYVLDMELAPGRRRFEELLAGEPFDVILADYRLHGFDAHAALEVGTAACPLTPFVCVSATVGEEVAVELLKGGAVDLVVKNRLARLHPRNRCIHLGFRSLALIPLRAGDEILGLLHLGDSHSDRLPREWIPFFEGLGASIGVAIKGKQAEEEIKQLNEQLSHRLVDRIAQLDMANQELESYAYAVSHDVRTPLRAIDGFSATVIEDEGEKLSPGAVDDLSRVRAAAQEMARLMDDLLGFSNTTHRDLLRRRVDLSALAAEVAEELAADDPARQVDVSIAPGLVADADPTLLRMILRELLGNAWKFTSHHDEARVKVGAVEAGGELEFYVRDDGAGFDEVYAKHLFGLFQRLHPRGTFPGDGVGLATVQRLVRRRGGAVWAEAEVEKGATFYFTLPPEADAAD